MTTYFAPFRWTAQAVRVDVRLCAEGEVTLLDRAFVDDPTQLVAMVVDRWGLPEAVLRDEQRDLAPIGWIVPAPASTATIGAVVGSPFGAFRAPGAYVEVQPCAADADEDSPAGSVLPWLLADRAVQTLCRDAGLLDGADAVVPALRAEYDLAWSDERSPTERFDRLLSVHTRARSSGAMLLAAHAADTAGHLLHRAGDFRGALTLHRWALGVYSRAGRGSEFDTVVALSAICHTLWHDDQLDAAVAAGERAWRLARRCGVGLLVGRAAVLWSYALADAGRAEQAASVLAPHGAFSSIEEGWWPHARAYAALRGDDRGAADELALLARRVAQRCDDLDHDATLSLRAEALDITAELARRRGDGQAADGAQAFADDARAALTAPFTH